MEPNPAQRTCFREGCLNCLPAIALLFATLSAHAQPTNDNFASAIEIVAVSNVLQTITLPGTTIDATVEPGENNNADLAAVNQRGTVWWKFTFPASGHIEFTAYSYSVSLMAGAFEGSSVSNLVTVSPPNSDIFNHPDPILGWAGGGAWVAGPAGFTCWFAVMSLAGSNETMGGDVIVSLVYHPAPPPPPPAPANDNFANRIPLTGTNLTVEGSNVSATTEPGENIGPGWVIIKATVWYSWTAHTNAVVYFSGSAPNPDFSFSLGTYVGTAVNTLSAAPSTPDGGFLVGPGDTIQLQIGSAFDTGWYRGGGTGPFTLNIRMVPRSATSSNDDFANRLTISEPTYHFDGSIYGATDQPGEPIAAPDLRQTLWWKFIPPDDGLIRFSVSAPFTPNIALFEGASFGTMIAQGGGNGNRYQIKRGHEYSLQLSSAPFPTGSFSMDTLFQSTSNDMFAGSVQLQGTNVLYTGNFTFATREPNEPTSGGPNTVWLSWTAPFDGIVRYNEVNSYQFQYLGIFTGSAVGTLQPVPITPLFNRTYSFFTTAGTKYHFQLSGGADDFTLSFQAQPFLPATTDHFVNAREVQGAIISFAPESVVGATMETGEPLHMDDAPQKSIWWKWQAPRHGVLQMTASSPYIPRIILAAYQGTAVDSLVLVGKGTNTLRFSAVSGQTYHIAAAVPADAQGDITATAQMLGMSSTSLILPDNLLREPSWEGTALQPQYWGTSGSIGGYVNEHGGAHGSTWPVLGTGARIWQDIQTIPGHEYAIQFAHLIGRDLSGCCGLAGVRVYWNEVEIGTAYTPENEGGFWRWEVFTAMASNASSRVTFENIHRNLEMDAFSVVDLNAPPVITSQPTSVSTLAGGTAAFTVGASGTAPLSYQWHFNGQPLVGQTAATLIINAATEANAGNYHVIVTNHLGVATSSPASLVVETPTNVTILAQPLGDAVPVGGYFNLSVVAAGAPPLSYQWFMDGQPVADATNRNIVFTNVQPADAGKYDVRVQNDLGTVWSLPATLSVVTNVVGGGLIDFRNRFVTGPQTNDAPIFDFDGATRLSGAAFMAQLYAGPSVETMRAVGLPSAFRTGLSAGYFVSRAITLPNVAPGQVAFAQIRVWESAKGSSYEEARALGGRFGRSVVMQVTAGFPFAFPPQLLGLTSFNLQAGLPMFTVGSIEFVERQPGDILVWMVQGQSGFRYLVERAGPPGGTDWRPFAILTNTTGSVTFTDTADSSSGAVLYRARILD